MANPALIIPHIKKWEGGFSNDPSDSGGATMMGVTLATYRQYFGSYKTVEDLKKITDYEWLLIFRVGYWDKLKGDQITNQSIAQLCADMCWMSGTTTALKKIQAALGLKADGIIGNKSLAALNASDTQKTFNTLWNMRKTWLEQIAKKGSNYKFLKGWLNRLNDCKYSK